MNKKRFSGIIPPLVTPVTPEGELDGPAVERLVKRVLEGGASGVFVNGTSGEAMRFSDRVWADATRAALAAAGPQRVFCGAIDASAARVVERIKRIADMGGVLAVCTAPFYLASFGQEEILRHFEVILENTTIDIAIYNIPESTRANILPETVARLARHERVVAYKDSTADWQQFQRVLFLLRDTPLSIFNGAEELCAAAMLYGADGCIPGLANFMPGLFAALSRACRAGDIPASYALQKRIYEIRKCLFVSGCWVAGMKFLTKTFGIGTDILSPGLENMSPAQEAEAMRILKENGAL